MRADNRQKADTIPTYLKIGILKNCLTILLTLQAQEYLHPTFNVCFPIRDCTFTYFHKVCTLYRNTLSPNKNMVALNISSKRQTNF